jgi:hypothetical protein
MTPFAYVHFLLTLQRPLRSARWPGGKGKLMSFGDIAFILAFIVLPTAIIVSSIWFIVLILKGRMLPPREPRPDVVDAEAVAEPLPDDAVPITRTTVWAEGEADDVAAEPAEPPALATLELPVVTASPAAAAEPEPVADPEPAVDAIEVVEAVEVAAGEPPLDTVVEDDEAVPVGFEATKELPIVAAEPAVASAPETEDTPPDNLSADEMPAAGDAPTTAAPPEDDEPSMEAAAALARRKPSRRLATRAAVSEELRPLAPARRASARKGEAAMEGSDRAVDVGSADDEGDIQFAGALGDRDDVDVLAAHGAEHATGDTRRASHSATDDGDDGDIPIGGDR